MARFAAFLDACVMVPIAPCDTLLRIADSGAFCPLWSQRVVDEAVRALQRIHPDVAPSRFLSRFHSMDRAFEDALVEGWEPLEQGIVLPDPNDRHVVAAAIRGRADVIVTENTKDFPERTLQPLGLKALRHDQFLLDHFELSPSAVSRIVTDQAAAMNRPPVDTDLLLARLARSGARGFAAAVRDRLAAEAGDGQQ